MRVVLGVLTAVVLAVAAPLPAHAAEPVEVVVTPDEPQAFQSPSVVADPVRPGRLAMAFQDGVRLGTCFLALSDDDGRTWTMRALAGIGSPHPLRPRDLCTKPMLAFGPDGTLFQVFQTSFLTRDHGYDVMLMASRDGGATWTPPRPVRPQPGVSQNWPAIAVDPRTARVYVSWASLPRDEPVGPQRTTVYEGTPQVSSSGDGGRTFGAPVVPDLADQPGAGPPLLAVAADGVLHLAYARAVPHVDADATPRVALVVARSADEGRTFRARALAGLHPAGGAPDPLTPHFVVRVFAIASGSVPGEVHLAWWRPLGETTRIFHARSLDAGERWTAARVIAVPDVPPSHHQHRPWFAVEPGGRIHVVFYDRDGLKGPQHTYVTSSDDRGASFSVPRRLSSVASDSRIGPPGEATGGAPSFGDYLGAAVSRDGLVAAWTDSRRGTVLTAKQDVVVAAPPLRDLALRIAPRRVRAGVRTTLRATVSTTARGRPEPVAGATVRVAGRTVTTDARGRARVVVRLRRPGLHAVVASHRSHADATRRLRVVRAR